MNCEEKLTFLRDALREMKGLYHAEHEDPWYSCPKSEYGCANPEEEGCTCGLDARNAKIDSLLSATE